MYWTYIVTNKNKTVLYVGVTGNLLRRVEQHRNNAGKRTTFAGRYNCYYLVYYEGFGWARDAIYREKQLKAWPRAQKLALINTENPAWETWAAPG